VRTASGRGHDAIGPSESLQETTAIPLKRPSSNTELLSLPVDTSLLEHETEINDVLMATNETKSNLNEELRVLPNQLSSGAKELDQSFIKPEVKEVCIILI